MKCYHFWFIVGIFIAYNSLFVFKELSNSIWALASAGIRGKNQLRLISFTADTLDEDDGSIIDSFKPQVK